jgi:hypothetical protein
MTAKAGTRQTMTHEQLVDYIRKATDHGMGNDEIRANLMKSGWDAAAIDAGFAEVAGVPAAPVAPGSLIGDADPLPSAVNMWKRAWGVFRKRMGTFLGISAVVAVTNGAFQFLSEALPKAYGWILLMCLVMVVAQILSGLAYIYAADDQQADTSKAYGLALKKFWRVIWLGIISSVIVGGLTCLGIVPGIIAGGWFLFSIYVLALENQGGMNALFISREYIRGKWWVAVGYTILPGFIVALIAAVMGGLIAAFKIPYAQVITGLVVVFFFTPTVAIYNYLVYSGFKKIKGPVSPNVTTNRKTKWVVLALVGMVAMAALLGGAVIMLFSALKNLDKGKLPINSSYQGSTQQMPSSEELNKLMQQFKDINVNVNVPPAAPSGWSSNIP